MADQIVEQLKKRKKELEAELKRTNLALTAFLKASPSVSTSKPATRKPMSEEAKQKIRDAQLRRHQSVAATSNAPSTTE